MCTQTITTITFEDHGQDFLKWEVDSKGEVMASLPFGHRVWCGCVVLNPQSLRLGGTVQYRSPRSTGRKVWSIKYPILAITKKQEVPNAQ